jgi:hypothetical protein
LVPTTLRLDAKQAAWLAKEAKVMGNANEVIRSVIDDAMHLQGLPVSVVEQLREDAKSKNLNLDNFADRREYLSRVLMQRYDSLVRGEIPKLGASPKSSKR